MKNREVACEFYEFEGGCLKGREGTFNKACQKCKLYKPLPGGRPARKDLRRQKKEDIRRKDMRRMMEDY